MSRYFMMVGCQDGWTALSQTATFLDARRSSQKAIFTETMANGRKAPAMRQVGYFSMYIDSDKGDELRVQAYRTSAENY